MIGGRLPQSTLSRGSDNVCPVTGFVIMEHLAGTEYSSGHLLHYLLLNAVKKFR